MITSFSPKQLKERLQPLYTERERLLDMQLWRLDPAAGIKLNVIDRRIARYNADLAEHAS